MNPDDVEGALPVLEDRTIVESINKADLKPLYDTDHEHHFVPDSEETNDYRAEVCDVASCNVGRLVRK